MLLCTAIKFQFMEAANDTAAKDVLIVDGRRRGLLCDGAEMARAGAGVAQQVDVRKLGKTRYVIWRRMRRKELEKRYFGRSKNPDATGW